MPNFPVHVYLIEYSGIGTSHSAEPRLKKECAKFNIIPNISFFNNEDELLGCIKKAYSGMLLLETENKNARFLLILSTHGKQETGTSIQTGRKCFSSLLEHSNLLRIRPKHFIVYLSICWGAFPDLLQAFHIGENIKPTIIGPLESIHPRIADSLINPILHTLVNNFRYVELLNQLRIKKNTDNKNEYPKGLFRIRLSSGKDIPGIRGTRFSSDIEIIQFAKIIALQTSLIELERRNGQQHIIKSNNKKFKILQIGSSEKGPDTAILLDDKDRIIFASLYSFPNIEKYKSIFTVLGKTFRMEFRISSSIPDDLRIIRIAEMVSIKKIISSFPQKLIKYKPPFTHSVESVDDKELKHFEIPPKLIDLKCKRCNWASIGSKQKQTFVDSKEKIVVIAKAFCRRTSCPLHSKFTHYFASN